MENWRMNKCNPALPSIASSSTHELRNQMESAGYFSCLRGSQDMRQAMCGRLQDPVLSSIQSSGSHKSEHVNLGYSFLSLLSGSPFPLQRDFQDISNSQPIGTLGKILPESNNSILNGTQIAIPLSSAGIPIDKLNWKNLQSGADFSHGSSKVVPSSICVSNSVLNESSDLGNVVICNLGPSNEKLKSSYALSGEWHSAVPASRANVQNSGKMPLEANTFISNQASRLCLSATPADSWKACRENIHASQKIPPEANCFISYQASSVCHGAGPADTGKAHRANIETSPKLPVEACSFISNQAPSFMDGCPRVFCSTTSGSLLLSNTGLLGIACSCHCVRMSASKFCEHSGLYGVNPGDAIRMDSGETIAQWCNLCLLKFGIRIPGDKNEWDWPEELSATSSFMKSSAPMPNISHNSSDLVFSPGGSVCFKQSISPSNNSITSPSLVTSAVSKKPERNIQDANNQFLKALTGTSQCNSHIADTLSMERAMSTSKIVGNGAQDGCQSISTYRGSMQNRTSSIAHTPLQERRIIVKESDFCRIENRDQGSFRDAANSNIELKLGQPYQLVQTSGIPDLSAVGSPLLGTAVNPMKSHFPQQMIANRENCREEVEFRQCDHFSAYPSNPSRIRDWNQSNHGINAFLIRNAPEDERVEKSGSNLAQNSVISLLSNLQSPSKENSQSKDNIYIFNDSGKTMRNTQHSEPLPVKYDPVLHSGVNSERQLDMSQLGSYKSIDNDKGMSFAVDSPHPAKDLAFRLHKEMELSSSFNRFSGNGEPNFLTTYRNSCHSQQLLSVPSGTPDSRLTSSYPEKVISIAGSGQIDHFYLKPLASSMGSGMKVRKQAVSKGIPMGASTSSADLIPAFCREEFIGVPSRLCHDKLQMPAPRKVQEILKQQCALPSFFKNQGEGTFGCSSYMQQCLPDNPASEKQGQKLSICSNSDVSEAVINPHQSGVACRLGIDEGSASMTGVNCCCNISRYKQENALKFKEVDLKHQYPIEPLCSGQPSLRSVKKSEHVTEPIEQERCCHKVPCGNFHVSSSCAAYRNCLERNSESRFGSSPMVFKAQMGTVNSETSMIFSPQFSNSHITPKEKAVSLDHHKRTLSREVPKNHTLQWRDVPSKVKGSSDVTRVDRLANLFDATREDREKLGDTCLSGTVQMADSVKEHEVSNISSGCSAPAVSQPSIEVNNMDASTNDARDNECGSNFVIDEESGIDKAWSSDDALESENSVELLASTSSSLRKVGPPKKLNHQSSLCLLDDLKLLNSLTWPKNRDQIPAGPALHVKDKHLANLEKGLNNGKRKRELGLKLNASCHTSDSSQVRQEDPERNGTCQFTARPSKSLKMLLASKKSETHAIRNCITQSNSKPGLHKSSSANKLSHRSDFHRLHNDKSYEVNGAFQTEWNGSTNNCEIAEVSGGKTGKRDHSFNAPRQFQIQKSSREDVKKTKCNFLDGFRSTHSQQVNDGHRKGRPIVCGIYGEISDGSLSGQKLKPAKLVPLSTVLNSSRKCILPKHCNSKSDSRKKKNLGGAVMCSAYDLKIENNKKCSDATIQINDTSMRKKKKGLSTGDGEFDKELFSVETQGDGRSEKGLHKLDGITHTQLQLKPKEIRKRSIYELTGKGEDPGFKSSSVFKFSSCLPAMKDGKLVNTCEDCGLCQHSAKNSSQEHWCHCDLNSDAFCCVCGSSNQEEINNLLECSQCSIKVHQACYGVSKIPKGRWSCRPCRSSSKHIVCVLCGYSGGAMTQALRSRTIVESILRAWNIKTESGPMTKLCSVRTLPEDSTQMHCSGYEQSESSSSVFQPENGHPLESALCKRGMSYKINGVENTSSGSKTKVQNSITMGLVDSETKQWVHMVCGLWTPETRCPNVDTMSAFDVSDVPLPTADKVCCMCKRAGGSCIQCRVENCSVRFHPWCAHQKGLLQTEVEGVDNEFVGFYGRCSLHATHSFFKSDDPIDTVAGVLEEKKLDCARTEGYKGRKRDGFRHNYERLMGSDGCLVTQEQLNAWAYINGQKLCTQELPKLAVSDIEHDSRKEYTRYKQTKSWKHLVVYKSGIHALGLYTSRFISRDEMVVEYVGEIVGQRVADKRENEYQSGKKLQYKSACYFFRIDKDHIIDATCKGGIARFVNHSCSPNCVAKVISVRNEKKVVFLAERDIFPGEEITYDYHFNHEDEGKKIPCFCSSKNCRRYLN